MSDKLYRFVKASEREPIIGDYYYCKVYDDYHGEQKTIIEWAEFKNGEYKYYDWDFKNVQHFNDFKEETTVTEWLEEITTPISEKESDFAEWCGENYNYIHSKKLNKSSWISNEVGVLVNGSDFHFTKLINEHGKTTHELYEQFKIPKNK